MALAPLPLWLPLALLAEGIGALGLTLFRLRHLPRLPETCRDTEIPPTCLCIPARNEGAEIGSALDSWLAQDIPHLRIVVVDDGSTDATSTELAARAKRHGARLRVLRNDHLPAGWLGKNHALHLATATPEARAAQWLLLADADVQAAPDLLRRVFALMEKTPADILALVPAVDTRSLGERLILPSAATFFLWLVPPERVADPRSAFFCGTGAFTLLRRSVYDRIGGHAAAPLEPIDDMMLARRAKAAGFLNRVAQGGPELHLRMYPSGWEVVRAMRKNILGIPGLWLLAPLLIGMTLALFSSPLWLAALGRPGFALTEWLLWPLIGPAACVGLGWAFWDRLRGINHWRGRTVPLRQP